MNKYVRVLRPEQWYKNIIVFLPLVFTGNLLNFSLYPHLLVSFLMLCLVSGIVYLTNDILDYERDRVNPEKKHRPIASGEISLSKAKLYLTLLSVLSLVLTDVLYKVSKISSVFLALLLANGALYSFFFKRHQLADIISISFNYVLRVLQGYSASGIDIDKCLLTCVFSFAIMMSSGKRIGEYQLLKERSIRHRSSLTKEYFQLLEKMLYISCSVFIMSFVMVLENLSILIAPLLFYLVGKYISFLYNDPYKVRHPHTLFEDKAFRCVFISTCLLILLAMVCIP